MNKYNISFQFKEDEVLATFYHSVNNALITEKDIRNALIEADESDKYTTFYLMEENLRKAINTQKILTEPLTFKIAERKDAVITVEVPGDKMAAYISIKPAYGGQPVTEEGIYSALKAAGINHGVNKEIVEEALQKGQGTHYLGANGTPPTDGTDALFYVLFNEPENKGRPRIKDNGKADFFDLGIVAKVLEGDSLMKKLLPTKGKPGITVTGEPIAAKDGKDKKLLSGRGSKISPDDPNLLIAAVSGEPRLKGNTVNVDQTFTVEEVGVATGNIDFTGTVIVNKSIKTGFKVRAKGDVIVNDIVENAEIVSDGNIILRGGLIGLNRMKIKSGENTSAKFVETGIIEANGSIYVSDIVMHSNLSSLDKIEVGDKDSKGQIIGGHIRALNSVKAKTIGSPGSFQTFIEVGINPYLQDNLLNMRKELENLKKKLNEIVKNIIYLKTHKPEKEILQEYEIERENLLVKINELTEEEGVIKGKMSNITNSKIIVTNYIYTGVKIKIFDHVKVFDSDSLGASFFVRDNEIVAGRI